MLDLHFVITVPAAALGIAISAYYKKRHFLGYSFSLYMYVYVYVYLYVDVDVNMYMHIHMYIYCM